LLATRAAAALMGQAASQCRAAGTTGVRLLTSRQIAQRMFLAEKTGKNWISRLLTKLGMETRTQVAVLATELCDQKPDSIS
jgi:hypothetical protein